MTEPLTEGPEPYTVMMRCGHAGNSWLTGPDGIRRVACVICFGVGARDEDGNDPSTVIDPDVDLTGRMARCSYAMRNPGPNGEHQGVGRSATVGKPDTPSSFRLAFFEHRPGQEFDTYYDGCCGWD